MKLFHCLALMLFVSVSCAHAAQDLRAWDNDTGTWTTDLVGGDDIGSLNLPDTDPKLVADSKGRVYVASSGRDSYVVKKRAFLNRYDGETVWAWDTATASWITNLSAACAIDTGPDNDASMPQVVADSQDRIYVAFQQSDGSHSHIYLSRYDGTDVRIWDHDSTSWTTNFNEGDPIDTGTGNHASFPQSSADPPRMVVDSQDRVYVTYVQYYGGIKRAYLTRFNGTGVQIWDHDATNWTATLADGDPICAANGEVAEDPRLIIDTNDTVYVSYIKDGAADHLFLNRYDGTDVRIWDNETTSWTTTLANGDPIDKSWTIDYDIGIDSLGRIYVVFLDTLGIFLARHDSGDMRIWDHNTTSWVTNFAAGTQLEVPSSWNGRHPALTVDGENRVYIVYGALPGSDPKDSYRLFMERYDGTNVWAWDAGISGWSATLADATPIDPADEMSPSRPILAADSADRVYVMYYNYEYPNYYVHLSRFNGTEAQVWRASTSSWTSDMDWSTVLNSAGGHAQQPTMTVDGADQVFISHKGPYLYRHGDSSRAEIDPVSVPINVTNQPLSYYIQPALGADLASVDRVEITVPFAYSNVAITSVTTNGGAVAYADQTAGNLIAINLAAPVTAADVVIRVSFTADTPDLPVTTHFTSLLADTNASARSVCVSGDGDAGGSASADTWTVSAVGVPVTSVEAEIAPVLVSMNATAVPFSYCIEPVIGPYDTGFDTIRIDVPVVYSNVSVSGVSVGGSSAGYSNATSGVTILVVLSNKVTASGTDIRVDFSADAPGGVDWGLAFTASLDDSTYPGVVACASGDGDGGGPVATDTWTVRAERVGNTFIQTSWLDGQYASVSNTTLRFVTDLRLESDPSNMVQLYDFSNATPYAPFYQLWGMTVYRDRLYLSVCKSTMESNNKGYLFEYDGTGVPTMFHEFPEDGMWKVRAFNDKLYVPGHDTAAGDKKGRLYIYDGDSWTFQYVTPGSSDHNMDVEEYNGELYVSNCQVNRYGGVYESYNNKMDWRQALSDKWWFGDKLKAFNGNLYYGLGRETYPHHHVTRPHLMAKFDGTAWRYIDPLNPRESFDAIAGFGIFNNALYLGCMESIFKYDDVTDTVAEMHHMDHITYEFAEHEGGFYAVSGQVFRDDLVGNGPEFRRYIPAGAHYTDITNNARLWHTPDGSSWTMICEMPEDEAISAHSWNGRLYVGTGGNRSGSDIACVYVSAYAPTGALTSTPYDTGLADPFYSLLDWSADTPAGTALRFQLRSADSEGGLGSSLFVGPDGTVGTFYTTPQTGASSVHTGDRWFQYRAFLSSTDVTNQTPILRSVSLGFGDTIEVENLPVSNLTASNATLNGRTVIVSSPADEVYVCWGNEDAGTTSTANWDYVEYMGTNWSIGDTFGTNVTLVAGTVYYYRSYIRSASDADWADTCEVFNYAAALPFIETFETDPPTMAGVHGPVHGQHAWTGDTGAVVQAAETWEFDQAAQIANAELSHTFEGNHSNVWTVFAWKPAPGMLDAFGVPSDATVVFWGNTNETLSAYSNQTPIDTGASVDTSQWVRVQVHSDYAQQKWSLWLDGTKVIENFGFYTNALRTYTGIRFKAYEGSTVYIDDVRVGTDAWNPQPGDTDGDGVPDDWELLYLNSPNVSDGSGDADNDGASDSGEEIAGTDPTDDTSVFMITNTTASAAVSNIVIRWPSVAERLYAVDGSSNLVEGFWSNIESNIAPTLPVNAYTVQVDSAEALFNRVRVRKE